MLQLSAPTPAPEHSSRVMSDVERYAPHDHPIVITGPIGAGKTHLAQLIHQRSGRRGSFVPVPLTSLQQGFEHATLAGHDKGAYTGAHRGRTGLLAEANGGTMLLDEIGDASVEGQRLLLELLTERGLRRLGEERRVRYDLRFILATHVDLDRATAEGRFREDLLSRLGNCWIHLPPLRERPEEIPALMDHYLAKFVAGSAGPALTLSAELTVTLVEAPWIYNVRSLVSECQSLATAGPADGVLRPTDLSERFWSEVRRFLGTLDCPNARMDRALAVMGGRRADAARLLEVTERTLYRRLEGKEEYRTARTRAAGRLRPT
jgi:DNA-binding NtrC family response regulator